MKLSEGIRVESILRGVTLSYSDLAPVTFIP